MIAFLRGEILHSNGDKTIILLDSGVGYEIFCREVLSIGSKKEFYISTITKESGTELYAFNSVNEKKFFELLIKVKGVGPKSAFSLMRLGVDQLCQAIQMEDRAILKNVPGIGMRVAAQIILDLKEKVIKFVRINSLEYVNKVCGQPDLSFRKETLMACRQLGFRDERVIPVVNNILKTHSISKSEELMQLVLKEL